MYNGWVVVGALAVIAAVTVALAGPVMSFFIPVMHSELGIPLFYFGLAMSTRQLAFALASPLLGRWIDRYGARPLLLSVAVFAGLLVYSLSLVDTGWQLVALVGLLGLAGLQGAGGELYGSVVIAKWFRENRGRAMSIAFIGTPAGIFFLTPLTQIGIENLGWQTVWQLYGIIGAVVLVVCALFVSSPPSAAIDTGADESSTTDAQEINWSREQAIRSTTFWKLAVAFGILMFTISTVAMFRVQHFFDRGLDPIWVAYAFSAEAAVSAVIAIPVGLLVERFKIHYLTAAGFSFAIIMLLLTINTHDLVMLFLATIAFGVGAASVIILQNTIWPVYFGSLHIGAIRGIGMPITLGFAILGAPVAGWVRDATGSFTPLWWATIGAMVLAIVLILSTPNPNSPQSGR
jgi:MFS family permease